MVACIYVLMGYYWWLDKRTVEEREGPIIVLTVPIVLAASAFRYLHSEAGYAGTVAAFTTSIVLIGADSADAQPSESAFTSMDVYVVSRMQQTFIGLVCLVTAQHFIFPTRAVIGAQRSTIALAAAIYEYAAATTALISPDAPQLETAQQAAGLHSQSALLLSQLKAATFEAQTGKQQQPCTVTRDRLASTSKQLRHHLHLSGCTQYTE